MWAAALGHWILNKLTLTVNIRNVCVMLAPFFAGQTALVTYGLAKVFASSYTCSCSLILIIRVQEIRDEATGLLAAAFISIVPGTLLFWYHCSYPHLTWRTW